jgi:peptidoglycan/xylan/chitin deacetylase (PgdA/CDA1 family)
VTGVNVREGPGTNFEVLTTLRENTQVTILDQSGEWSNIRVNGMNMVGWSISEALQVGYAPTPTPTSPATATPKSPPTSTPRPVAAATPTNTQAPQPSNQVSGQARIISAGNKSRAVVALTFDGGAGSAPTKKILDTLRKHNVRVTMFVTGKWAEENPALIRQMVADGHEFANHTYTHSDLTKMSDAAITDEIKRTEQIIINMTGQNPKPYFRPPYGAYNARVANLLHQLGYYTIMWTLDSGDWLADSTVQTVLNKVVTQSANGSIVVQHLGEPKSADALDTIIVRLKERGFTIGTMTDVLR